jgi:hypothetical protein
MMTQRVLTEMADLLNSDGINYSVSLSAYLGLKEGTDDVNSIINRLIGHKVVLNSLRDASVAEVVETLRQSLGYVGDDSAGPGPSVLKSRDFSRLMESICDSVVQLSQAFCRIESFEFAEGHPHYPVFWDFAYLFRGNDEHLLLVGSSSD